MEKKKKKHGCKIRNYFCSRGLINAERLHFDRILIASFQTRGGGVRRQNYKKLGQCPNTNGPDGMSQGFIV